MSHRRLWIAAAIIAFVVITGFVLSVPHTKDSGSIPVAPSAVLVPSVSLRDTYKKGVHNIAGTVEAPNACTSVTAESSVTTNASTTDSIVIAITMLVDEKICLQLPTRINFQTTVSAAAKTPIVVTVNGAPATTTTP